MQSKELEDITRLDIEKCLLWIFVDPCDGTTVKPCQSCPDSDLHLVTAFTNVQLANGEQQTVYASNISLNRIQNDHFLSFAFFNSDWEVFHLARYFDPWYSRLGPEALAKHLQRPVDAIFPFQYDLQPVLNRDNPALCGTVHADHRHPLNEEERMNLIVTGSV